MKRILVIILCLFSITSVVMADEKEDSLNYYVQRLTAAYESGDNNDACFSFKYALRLYKELAGDISQDTVYALRLFQYADLCCKINDYDTAVELMKEASSIYKNVFGIENYLYASCLDYLAYYCSLAGNYNDAIQFGLEASEICKRIFGRNHPRYATSISNLATYYAEVEKYNEAIRLGTEALEIREKTVGKEHPDYLNALTNLTNYYAGIRRYDETVRLGSEVLELRKTLQGNHHPDYVSSLEWLANHCANNKNYNDAVRLGTEAVEIIKKVLGSQHPDYAITLSNLANYYAHLGDYAKAIELGTEVLDINRVLYGTMHPNYAIVLSNVANYYSELGDYVKAVELGTENLEIYKKLYSEEDPDYAIVLCMCHLSNDYAHLGDYVKAVELDGEAIKIYRKLFGEDHPEYANLINNLAEGYFVLGEYEKAIELGIQALNIQRKLFGENHLVFVKSLGNLVRYYLGLGDYAKAIELATKIQDICSKSIDNNHPEYADILNNLANLYSELGDYEKAIELNSKALEIRRNIYGEEHFDYATSLGSIAVDYCYLGNYERAIELDSMALEICKKALGAKHPISLLALHNLASLYYFNDDYAKAIELGTQVLDFRLELFGKEHPDYASSLNLLANCYSHLNDNAKAIELGVQTLKIYLKVLGREHPDYANSLINLAQYYYDYGNSLEAISLVQEYLSIIRRNVFNTFSELTSSERLHYWNKYSKSLNSTIPEIIIHSSVDDAASMLYDNTALFAKGLLLSTELEMSNLIQENGDDDALQMYYELHQNRQILNTQYSKPIAERSIDCDSLERVSTNLERQLVSRVKEFGDYTRNLSNTWRDVQRKLNEDDIAIEFLSYQENDSATAYAALTLCKNDSSPMLTHLFTDTDLIYVSGDNGTYQTLTADSLIWGPLSSRLESKLHVYFSASGMLHNIGIEYLPSMEGKECYRLSSTRELVIHQQSPSISSATLYGDIDYDATYASIEAAKPSNEYYAMTTESGKYRGNFDYRSMRYGVSPLPGTRAELKEVTALLTPAGVPCDALTGTQASEESFKALSGQRKSLLHISTHGFYYNAEDASNQSDHIRMMLMGDSRPSHAEDQSLLRCGLCFAGANQVLSGESQPAAGQGDGILNALEIAQTDLRGLDLVVLSACQTALGDISQGEGVFGLQRGFKKAGVRSILMSLWNVDDEVTQMLMTEFYRGWTSGMTKTAALKNAQSIVKQKYPDPRHWAAFILLDALD